MLNDEIVEPRQRPRTLARNDKVTGPKAARQSAQRAEEHRLVTKVAIGLTMIDEHPTHGERSLHFHAAHATMLGQAGS